MNIINDKIVVALGKKYVPAVAAVMGMDDVRFSINILSKTDDSVAYTTIIPGNKACIYINTGHELFQFNEKDPNDKKRAIRRLFGVIVHEMLHKKYTDPSAERVITSSKSIRFKNFYHWISNVVEDFTIESRAICSLEMSDAFIERKKRQGLDLVSLNPIRSLTSAIFKTWLISPQVKETDEVIDQVQKAMIQFTDMGPLVTGSTVSEEAAGVLKDVYALLLDAVWLNPEERAEKAFQIYRICEKYIKADCKESRSTSGNNGSASNLSKEDIEKMKNGNACKSQIKILQKMKGQAGEQTSDSNKSSGSGDEDQDQKENGQNKSAGSGKSDSTDKQNSDTSSGKMDAESTASSSKESENQSPGTAGSDNQDDSADEDEKSDDSQSSSGEKKESDDSDKATDQKDSADSSDGSEEKDSETGDIPDQSDNGQDDGTNEGDNEDSSDSSSDGSDKATDQKDSADSNDGSEEKESEAPDQSDDGQDDDPDESGNPEDDQGESEDCESNSDTENDDNSSPFEADQEMLDEMDDIQNDPTSTTLEVKDLQNFDPDDIPDHDKDLVQTKKIQKSYDEYKSHYNPNGEINLIERKVVGYSDATVGLYKRICDRNRMFISAFARKMSILTSEDEEKEADRKGNLNLSRYARQHETSLRFFDKTYVKQRKDSRVLILLDCSGSMCGDKIETAKNALVCIVEGLHKAGIPVCVMTFNVLGHSVTHELYVNFKPSIGDRSGIVAIKASGCNFDGFAIRAGTKLLEKERAKNTLMIIISDGQPSSGLCPNDVEDTRKAVALAKKKTKVVGIGVDADLDVLRSFYKDTFVEMTNMKTFMNDLTKVITKEVKKWT